MCFISLNNIVEGGLNGITVGHASPYQAHYSVVGGNIVDSPASNGIILQYTNNTSISSNIIIDSVDGIVGASGSKGNVLSGNVIVDPTSEGVRLGVYSLANGNLVTGSASSAFRGHVDNLHGLFVGNIAMNGAGVAFDAGVAGSQVNHMWIGNFAGDDQGTATQTKGFANLSGQNILVGNSTDGNHTTAEFAGTYSGSGQKDTSVSAAVAFTASDATPSVISPEDFFVTADTTTYTDFDDSRGDGHTFKLLALHAATVTDGANIKTSTGANKTLTVNVVYEFTSRSGVWYENATA